MAKRNIRIRAVRREEVDIDKLVSGLLLLLRELEDAGGLPAVDENQDPAA